MTDVPFKKIPRTLKELEEFIVQQEETTYYQLIYPQEVFFVKAEENGAGNSRIRSSVSNEPISDPQSHM